MSVSSKSNDSCIDHKINKNFSFKNPIQFISDIICPPKKDIKIRLSEEFELQCVIDNKGLSTHTNCDDMRSTKGDEDDSPQLIEDCKSNDTLFVNDNNYSHSIVGCEVHTCHILFNPNIIIVQFPRHWNRISHRLYDSNYLLTESKYYIQSDFDF